MKIILIVLFLTFTFSVGIVSADGALGWSSDSANYNGLELRPQVDLCSSNLERMQPWGGILVARNDIGQCIAACASEQGICISQCQGNGQCIANCAAAYGRCVSRCN